LKDILPIITGQFCNLLLVHITFYYRR